jgi:hypothetical protein
MASTDIKRGIWGFVGLLYAIVYGFWTAMATGGGHGNFVWFYLFLKVDLLGFFFPLMFALAADLRPKAVKIVVGILLVLHLIASVAVIAFWILGYGRATIDDFDKTVGQVGYIILLFCGFVHFLPSFIFSLMLVNSARGGDHDELIDLDLK